MDREDFGRETGVSRETLDGFDQWRALLIETNAHTNLIGRSTLDQFWHRHALDSYQLLEHLSTDVKTVADLGAGAGESVEEQLSRSGSIPLGGAVMTPAGALPFDFLIHVVVMSEDEPQSTATVQKAVRNGLRRATDWALDSLALPP